MHVLFLKVSTATLKVNIRSLPIVRKLHSTIKPCFSLTDAENERGRVKRACRGNADAAIIHGHATLSSSLVASFAPSKRTIADRHRSPNRPIIIVDLRVGNIADQLGGFQWPPFSLFYPGWCRYDRVSTNNWYAAHRREEINAEIRILPNQPYLRVSIGLHPGGVILFPVQPSSSPRSRRLGQRRLKVNTGLESAQRR